MSRRSGELCRHPPTWVSVLGNGGFWPVAVMDFKTSPGRKNPEKIAELGENEKGFDRLTGSAATLPHTVAFLAGRRPNEAFAGMNAQGWLDMPLSMKFLMLGVFLWADFHVLCCCRASITVKPALERTSSGQVAALSPDSRSAKPLPLRRHKYMRIELRSLSPAS